MTYEEWKKDPKAQKKTWILAGLVSAILGCMWLPSMMKRADALRADLNKSGSAHTATYPTPAKPAPPPNAPPVLPDSRRAPVTLPPVVTPPVADDFTGLTGSYDGTVNLPSKGQCKLGFSFKADEHKAGIYRGASELACFNMLDFVKHSQRGPTGPLPNVTLNPTSATFEGQAKDGELLMKATENIIPPGTYKACEMVSISLKPFPMDKKISAKWEEVKKPDSDTCDGGAVILSKR